MERENALYSPIDLGVTFAVCPQQISSPLKTFVSQLYVEILINTAFCACVIEFSLRMAAGSWGVGGMLVLKSKWK